MCEISSKILGGIRHLEVFRHSGPWILVIVTSSVDLCCLASSDR